MWQQAKPGGPLRGHTATGRVLGCFVHLNKRLGRSGRFWQVDGFDHLVRTEVQFDSLRRYIADNPRRARLRDGEFAHYTAEVPTVDVSGCQE